MKYSQIFKNVYSSLFVAGVILLTACTNDTLKYDVTGDTVNRVYVQTPTSWINNYSFSVLHTPLTHTGTIFAKFPALSTKAAASNLKVTFAVDHSLVATYNAAHSTTYSQVPDSIVTMINTTLNIPKDSASSIDSMSISINNARLFYLTNPGYVIPIRITSLSNAVSNDKSAVISTNESIVYVVITTSFTNCIVSPLITDMVGTIVTTRTGWTATLDKTLNSGTLANLFDAKTTTYWYVTPASEVNLVVNLSKAYTNIKGIRIHSYSTSYSLTSLVVYTSSDNINWTSQGIASLSGANSYQYIKFYSPIPTAQYIKLDVKGWKSSTYVIMAEFDIYQ
jgi:hypothetical protein